MVTKGTNQVRIIAGQWRSRRLLFPTALALRPTHDRLRETLFNWLMPAVQDAHCLDCFAGSGALGFEALSRGAQWVTFIEQQPAVQQAIKDNIKRLNASACDVVLGAFPGIMRNLPEVSYDIVFLDPPFGSALVPIAAGWLQDHQRVHSGSLVYVEVEKTADLSTMPVSWELWRQKTTATLCCLLYQVS